MTNEKMLKTWPLPWRCEAIDTKPTRTCHHKTRTWVIVDANGRRVFWTEAVVRQIVEVMNGQKTTFDAVALCDDEKQRITKFNRDGGSDQLPPAGRNAEQISANRGV